MARRARGEYPARTRLRNVRGSPNVGGRPGILVPPQRGEGWWPEELLSQGWSATDMRASCDEVVEVATEVAIRRRWRRPASLHQRYDSPPPRPTSAGESASNRHPTDQPMGVGVGVGPLTAVTAGLHGHENVPPGADQPGAGRPAVQAA